MAVEGVFRDHWGRVLATLVGMFRDIELAEDVAQEAFAIAAERWPRDGEPANPTAWLITIMSRSPWKRVASAQSTCSSENTSMSSSKTNTFLV